MFRKKRRAYVGLSSPILYDYKNLATKCDTDGKSHPNPILESPFGLMLLYDEIYFFCRSLCPENMRELEYVHFIDEENLLHLNYWDISRQTFHKFHYKKSTDIKLKSNWGNTTTRRLKNDWNIKWINKASNHTHTLNFGEHTGYAGEPTIFNLELDLIIMENLNIGNLELITNSITNPMFVDQRIESLKNSMLSEYLILHNIPNYLTPSGPYHPCIEQVRSNGSLEAYRTWISSNDVSIENEELTDFKNSIEDELQIARVEVFDRYIKESNFFYSIGKSLISDIAGLVVPGVSTLTTLGENILSKKKNYKWQSFIVSARRELNT